MKKLVITAGMDGRINMADLLKEAEKVFDNAQKPRKAVQVHQRPPRKELTVVEINIKDMWKRAEQCMFLGLQDPGIPVTAQALLDLTVPFGGPNQMRQALRDFNTARILLGDRYEQVADMVIHHDPFVIVIRKGNDVWATVNPLEDVH